MVEFVEIPRIPKKDQSEIMIGPGRWLPQIIG